MTKQQYETYRNGLATFLAPNRLTDIFGPPELFSRPDSAAKFITVDVGVNEITVAPSTSVLFIGAANPDDDTGPVQVTVTKSYLGQFSNGPVFADIFYRGGVADDNVTFTIEGGGEIPNGMFNLGEGDNILNIEIDATSADVGAQEDFRGFSFGVASGSGDDIIDIFVVGLEPQQGAGISEQSTFTTPVSIDVKTHAGDDQVTILHDLAIYNNYRALVDTGDGNDIVDFVFDTTQDDAAGAGGGKVKFDHLSIKKFVDSGDGDDTSTTDISIVVPTLDADDGFKDVYIHFSAIERAGAGDDLITWELDLSGTADSEVRLTGSAFIDGGEGNDAIFARLTLEKVLVSSYNFYVDGGAGDDRIDIGVDSLLDGQADFGGLVTISGGSGIDTFVATKGQTAGTIGDFIIGEDVLFLAAIFSTDEFDATTIAPRTPNKIGPGMIPGNVATMITDADGVLLAIIDGITADELVASPDSIVLDEPIDVPLIAIQTTDVDLLL